MQGRNSAAPWARILVLPVLVFGLRASSARADVKLASILGESMVLQQGVKAPIWGTAEPGEKVRVAFRGQKAAVEADADGTWRVVLEPLKPGGPFEMTIAGRNTIALRNVLVGEVWVCSGQSNMAMVVRGCANAQQEIAASVFPRIRLFTVKRKTSRQPADAVEGGWSECSPDTAASFSGVGYFFGRRLHRELKVPIGLINTSWGGTPAEAWTSLPALEAAPELKPVLDRWETVLAAYPDAEKKHQEQMAKWREAAEKAKAEGKPRPRAPRPPMGPDHPHRPANLYNGMIAPLIPFAIRGAIWYQGESNAGRAYQYRTLFPAMIRDWRKQWGQGDFPFYWVQLANFLKVDPEPKTDPWPELREAQTMTLAVPNTGQAVIIDVGEFNDIHPRNKQTVGERLALNALALTYGKRVACTSPMLHSMQVEGSKARVKLKHAGGGLVARPFTDPVTPNGPTLQKRLGVPNAAELRPKSDVLGFAVAGEDKQFVWAEAKIVSPDTVEVWSDKVAKPVAVRYAWSNNPICNLYNKDGLPACPFRTDDWPGATAKAE